MAELIIEEITIGNGVNAKSGDAISVHYTGWLTNGKKFDSSVDRNDPFDFTLGVGQVIPGWDQGVEGMQIGASASSPSPLIWLMARSVLAGLFHPMQRLFLKWSY